MSASSVQRFLVPALIPFAACLNHTAGQCTLHQQLTLAPSGLGFAQDYGGILAAHGDIAITSLERSELYGDENSSDFFVFRRIEEGWIYEAKLSTLSTYYSIDSYGRPIDIGKDLIVIGAPGHIENDAIIGAAHVFRFQDGRWRQEAILTASDATASDSFGASVAIAGDRLAIGAPDRSSNDDFTREGAVYVFSKNASGQWEEEAILTVTIDRNLYGYHWAELGAVLAGQQGEIIAGAPNMIYGQYIESGVVFVYRLEQGKWIEAQRILSPTGDEPAAFGSSLALDRDQLIVGAPGDKSLFDGGARGSGAAYVFRRSDAGWEVETRLAYHGTNLPVGFGHFVDINNDMAMVSSVTTEPELTEDGEFVTSDYGSVHLFRKVENVWNFEALLEPSGVESAIDFGKYSTMGDDFVLVSDFDLSRNGYAAVYLFGLPTADCNLNDVSDAEDICTGAILDCNRNNVPDTCEIETCSGDPLCRDCNNNGLLDGCEIADCSTGAACSDCNLNGSPDQCDIDSGAAKDGNANGIPDDCDCPASAKLPNSYISAGGRLGPVSISGDWIVAGAECDSNNPGSTCEGSAVVFHYNGTEWIEQQELTPSETGSWSYFGRSVWIDQHRLVVGAPCVGYDYYGDCTGAAFVFEYDGSSWIETAKLVADDETPGSWFGTNVRLHGDRIAVAEICDVLIDSLCQSSVYVFRLEHGEWKKEAEIESPAESWGSDVSLALKDQRLLIGASWPVPSANPVAGRAYHFEWDGNQWQQVGEFSASDSTRHQEFGASVSLGDDIALVGAPRDDQMGIQAGAAYVFRLSNGEWKEEAKLVAPDAAPYDHFGRPVRIDADRVVISALIANYPGKPDAGAAYLFRYTGSGWSLESKLSIPSAAVSDQLGLASISGDDVVVTAWLADSEGTHNVGAVYVFDRSDCNKNGVVDIQETCLNVDLDKNLDRRPDECDSSELPTSPTPAPSSAGARGCGTSTIMPILLCLTFVFFERTRRRVVT